jgi:hypothetical protein
MQHQLLSQSNTDDEVEQINDRGNWTRAKTFGKFYDKQVGKIDNFQQALFK